MTASDSSDESAQQVFNHGLISEWHILGVDYPFFLNLVRIGDRLEMKRQGYCHWVVFVGVQYVILEEDGPHVLVPCVVHRNNPADDPSVTGQPGSGIFRFSGSTRMSSKAAYGIGDICLEPLRDVWGQSQIRINNKLDHTMEPLPSKEVVERLMTVFEGKDSMSYTPYNVMTNNCEHFASWARNSWATSRQVSDMTQKVLAAGAAALTLFLPRPISLVAGAAMVGMHALRQGVQQKTGPSSKTTTTASITTVNSADTEEEDEVDEAADVSENSTSASSLPQQNGTMEENGPPPRKRNRV